MKTKTLIVILFALIFPLSAFAISAPKVDSVPSSINANTYTFTIRTEPGAKVTVVGGPADIAPVTDGADGDNQDGVVKITVGLAQETENVFSIIAEKDGAASPAAIITINENSTAPSANVTELGTSEDDGNTIFGDTKDHWAEQYVKELYEMGAVNGKTETKFDPDAPITRAELTKIAILAFGNELPESITEKPFSDVPLDAWYTPYITVAKNRGISHGYADGTYKPQDYIDRASALKIIIRAAGVDAKSVSSDFIDVPITAWFAPYVTYAFKNDIVSGYSDNTFRPGNNVTRAEVAKIVIKMLDME